MARTESSLPISCEKGVAKPYQSHLSLLRSTRSSTLTQTLFPWLAVQETRDLEMITTSTVSVCKKDNCRNRSRGEFGAQKWVRRTKNVKITKVEQRYIIKFFFDEGIPGPKSPHISNNIMGLGALSLTQVGFSIGEAKRGRINLNTTASPGREPDEGLAAVIAGKPDADSHLSARKLAPSLGLQPQWFVDI
jgi:hypothetical protein